jgi:hypothetical protein
MHKLMRVDIGYSLGRQEWSNHMSLASEDIEFQKKVIVTSHITWV